MIEYKPGTSINYKGKTLTFEKTTILTPLGLFEIKNKGAKDEKWIPKRIDEHFYHHEWVIYIPRQEAISLAMFLEETINLYKKILFEFESVYK